MADRVSSPDLIGRARELDLLLRAVRDGGAGGRRLVLVEGEAGVGKSRLVQAFTAAASEAGATVAAGNCLALDEEGVPYAPFAEVIRTLFGALPPAASAALREDGWTPLALLVPDLSASPHKLAGAEDRAAAFQAVVGLIERVSQPVVVVEDLHWADRSSRDLLAFLLHRARRNLVVVATCRNDELAGRDSLRAFLAEADRAGHLVRLELARLDRSQVFDQLASILGVPPGAALAEEIWSRSEGNPFLAEELLALARAGHGGGLPGSLRDLLLARTSSLGEATHALLRVAAAGGSKVDERLLTTVTGLPEEDVHAAARPALAAAVLKPDADGRCLAFRHALLREAIYADLLPGERRRHHLAFAQALSEHPDWAVRQEDLAAELAHHFHAGGNLHRALQASLVAGQAAERRTAFPEASRQYQRVIDLWDQVADAEAATGLDQVSLLERAADVALLGGAVDRAVAVVRRALDRLGEEGGPVRPALLHERLARLLWLSADAESSVTEAAQAVRLLASEPPSRERARVVAVDAQSLLLAAKYPESHARAGEAVELARAAGDQPVEGNALNTLGVVQVYLGQADAGLAALHRARELAESLGRVDDVQRAWFNLATAAATMGRIRDAEKWAVQGADVVGRLGFLEGRGYLWRKAAECQLQLGRWEVAAGTCRQVLELVSTPLTIIQTHTIAGTLALRMGQLGSARAHLEAATSMSAELANGWFHGWLLCARAELALAEGRGDDAVALVEEIFETVAATDAEVLLRRLLWLGVRGHGLRADAATVDRATRRQEAAAVASDLVERARPAIARMRARSVGPYLEGEALAATVVAELEEVGGRPSPRLWSRAVDAWSSLDQPFETAYGHWRRGAALLAARSDRSEAESALFQAREIAAGLGAEPLRNEIADLARRARLHLVEPGKVPADENAPPAESPAEAIGLTKREAEVLNLVAAGRSNRQIAAALFMSEKTASVHVSRILTKLAVTSRGEAAALAHRLGLVEDAGA